MKEGQGNVPVGPEGFGGSIGLAPRLISAIYLPVEEPPVPINSIM